MQRIQRRLRRFWYVLLVAGILVIVWIPIKPVEAWQDSVDTFDRADTDPLSNDANWGGSGVLYDMELLNNQIRAGSISAGHTCGHPFATDTDTEDQYTNLRITDDGSGMEWQGLTIRLLAHTPAADVDGYLCRRDINDDADWEIQEVLDGGGTKIASSVASFSPGDMITCTVQGDQITVFANYEEVISITDSSYTGLSQVQHGVNATELTTVDADLDDWSGGDFRGSDRGLPYRSGLGGIGGFM